jgi:mannose/cellobiose epimerase-like protein (N-acyl-D-glucosamine 2-epimerase family)
VLLERAAKCETAASLINRQDRVFNYRPTNTVQREFSTICCARRTWDELSVVRIARFWASCLSIKSTPENCNWLQTKRLKKSATRWPFFS